MKNSVWREKSDGTLEEITFSSDKEKFTYLSLKNCDGLADVHNEVRRIRSVLEFGMESDLFFGQEKILERTQTQLNGLHSLLEGMLADLGRTAEKLFAEHARLSSLMTADRLASEAENEK